MNISLTSELEEFVDAMVGSGMYSSASEVVRAGLRLLRQTEQLHASRLSELRSEVAEGLDELERGGGEPLDMEKIKDKARARRGAKRGRA